MLPSKAKEKASFLPKFLRGTGKPNPIRWTPLLTSDVFRLLSIPPALPIIDRQTVYRSVAHCAGKGGVLGCGHPRSGVANRDAPVADCDGRRDRRDRSGHGQRRQANMRLRDSTVNKLRVHWLWLVHISPPPWALVLPVARMLLLCTLLGQRAWLEAQSPLA